MHLFKQAIAIGIVVVLVGCGGGATHSSVLPATPAKSQNGAHTLTIKIDVPKKSAPSSARRAQYISQATTQMLIDVQQAGVSIGAPFPETVALTPTSGGCASTLASTTCVLTIAIGAPGSYTLNVAAEDGSGTALSTAQAVPFTVVEGMNNVISLTLSGVPTSIVAVQNPFELYSIIVDALDADNNVIVGPGAPTFAVSQTSGSLGLTLVQPTAAV